MASSRRPPLSGEAHRSSVPNRPTRSSRLSTNDRTDPATAVGTSPLTFVRVVQPTAAPTQLRVAAESTADPAIQSEQANERGFTGHTRRYSGSFAEYSYAIILAPFVLVFFGIAIVISAIQNFFYSLADATAVPTAMAGPILSEPAAITTALAEPADAASATENRKADVSPPVTSTDTLTHTEQMTATGPATENEVSTDTATSRTDVTETAESDVPDEASPEPTAVETPKPSAKDSASEPTSVTVRPATPPACATRFARSKRATAKSAAPRQWRPPDHPDRRCR